MADIDDFIKSNITNPPASKPAPSPSAGGSDIGDFISKNITNAGPSEAAPAEERTPGGALHSFLSVPGEAIWNTAMGAAKGLTGLGVGLGQRVSSATEAMGYETPSNIAASAPAQAVKQWAIHPEGVAQHIGSWIGAAAPAVALTAATGGLAAPSLLAGAGLGAAEGFIQPTESGTIESAIPGAIAGGLTGGALGRLGSSEVAQKALGAFNKKLYDHVLEPLRNYGFNTATPGVTGRAGIDALERRLAPMARAAGPHRKAARESYNRLQQLKSMSSPEGHVDPGMIMQHLGRSGYTNDPFMLLAEQAQRQGVPSLYRRAGLSKAALHLLPWVLRAAHIHAPGLHTLAHAVNPTGQRNIMSDLSFLARNANQLRRYGMLPASEAAADITGTTLGERGAETETSQAPY